MYTENFEEQILFAPAKKDGKGHVIISKLLQHLLM